MGKDTQETTKPCETATVSNADLQKVLQVATVDELARAVKAQAAMGITDLDDFDEGNDIDRENGLPGWAPLTKRDGTKLHYYLIGVDNFQRDERTNGSHGKKPLAVPVAKVLGDVFADLPDYIFNARGFAQVGDCILCVSLQTTYEWYKKKKLELSDARAQTLQKSTVRAQSDLPLGCKVEGEMVAGFGVPVMSH